MIPLGINITELKAGENHLPCPACDRGPGDLALSVRLDPGSSVVWYCHRCEIAGSNRFGDSTKKTPLQTRRAAPTSASAPRGLSEYGRQLWASMRPIAGPAMDYLQSRACRLPPDDGDLRCATALKHPSGYIGPALVALITDAETGASLSLHRTWIKPDGSKADVTPPRMLLKNHRIGGGVIRLWPKDPETADLGIAEGIETALSLAHGITPVWACIDAGHLARFPVLAGVRGLVIATDNDDAGRKAATACARRWAARAAVRVVAAATEGCDLNDEVRTWAK